MVWLILTLGIGLVLIGGVMILWSCRRWIMEKWRVWQYRHQFRPPPPANEYHLIRMDLPPDGVETSLEYPQGIGFRR